MIQCVTSVVVRLSGEPQSVCVFAHPVPLPFIQPASQAVTVLSVKLTVQLSVFFEFSSMWIGRTRFCALTHSAVARSTSIGRRSVLSVVRMSGGNFHDLARSKLSGPSYSFGFANRCARYSFHSSRSSGESELYAGTEPYSKTASRIC